MALESETIFDYSSVPLDSSADEIRLLAFPDQKLDGNRQIQCRLEVFRLEDAPRYTALSYSWGNLNQRTPLRCNGNSIINVTLSLKDGLSYIIFDQRSPFVQEGHAWIWIDAICINQDDFDERKAQVLLMRKIYESANHTFIWLGRADPGSTEAFNFLLALNDARERYDKAGESRLYGELSADERDQYGIPADRERPLSKLNALLEKGWFTRAWVIQELAVSKWPIVLLSPFQMSWDNLVNTTLFMLRFYPTFHFAGVGWERVTTLASFRNYIQGQHRIPLLRLLILTKTFGTTDARDKVYALIGVSGDSGPESLNIQPDYSIDPDTLFSELAVKLLLNQGYLEFLNSITRLRSGKESKLPSWVPDWNVKSEDMITPFIPVGNFNVGELRYSRYENFAAAPPMSASTSVPTGIVSHKNALAEAMAISGFPLDSISRVGKVNQFVISTLTPLKSLDKTRILLDHKKVFRSNESVCTMRSNARYPATGESMSDVYWQVQSAGNVLGSDESVRRGFQTWYDEVDKYYRFLPPFVPLADLILRLKRAAQTPFSSDRVTELHSRKEVGDYLTSARSSSHGRSMFCTQSGFVGLGPCDIARGDEVFILRGCRTPMVLRRTQAANKYTLVGACYVHGVMRGEAFSEDRCQQLWLV